MAPAFVQISFQCRYHSYGGKGNAFRTPSETPFRSKHLYGPHDIFIIVQRLSHPHEDRVGQPVGLVYRQELGQYVRCGKMSVKSLPSRHAESASHPAAGLGGNTERRPVIVRNHYGLYRALLHTVLGNLEIVRKRKSPAAGAGHGEKVFSGAVRRHLHSGIRSHACLVFFRKGLSSRLGDIRHLIYCADLGGIQPSRHLRTCKGGQSLRHGYFLQFFRGLPQ